MVRAPFTILMFLLMLAASSSATPCTRYPDSSCSTAEEEDTSSLLQQRGATFESTATLQALACPRGYFATYYGTSENWLAQSNTETLFSCQSRCNAMGPCVGFTLENGWCRLYHIWGSDMPNQTTASGMIACEKEDPSCATYPCPLNYMVMNSASNTRTESNCCMKIPARYALLKKACVTGANINKYPGKSVAECEAICGDMDNCDAFEMFADYGASSTFVPGDCQPQKAANYQGCNGAAHNIDLYIKERPELASLDGYTYIPQGCVSGANIQKYPGKSVAKCAAICNGMDNCDAFEMFADYGASSSYVVGDCQPQKAANYQGCNGAQHNLDLYIKAAHPSTR